MWGCYFHILSFYQQDGVLYSAAWIFFRNQDRIQFQYRIAYCRYLKFPHLSSKCTWWQGQEQEIIRKSFAKLDEIVHLCQAY